MVIVCAREGVINLCESLDDKADVNEAYSGYWLAMHIQPASHRILCSSSSSVIMGEGRASLPTSQLYTWIVRWKVIT